MKAKRIILFFLLLSALIPPINAADYGEDEPYLGQVVDDYETDDNVTAAYNVIHNATLDCMELNYSSENILKVNYSNVDLIEYFETFTAGWTTATGGGGTISKDATQVYNGSWAGKFFDPNIASFGYGYKTLFEEVGDYIVSFHLWVDDSIQPDNIQLIALYDVSVTFNILTYLDYHDGNYYLVNRFGVANYEDVSIIPNGEWLHIVFMFNDTSNKVVYYVDSIYKGEFSIWGDNNPDRIYLGDGSAVVGKGYYYLDDLIVGRGNLYVGDVGYDLSGHYYTTEILANDTGLVLMYNVTIPEGTGGTVEFSTDNLTWVDHHNLPGSDTLIAGFESLDLRDINESSAYLRFNFTSDRSDTLRIYQIRFVTITNVTIGNGDGETVYVDTLFPGLAIGISLLIIMVILALEKGR